MRPGLFEPRPLPIRWPSWLLDRDDNLTLLDKEVVEALQDETVRAVLREVIRLPERERRIVLEIVRQFGEMSG